MCIGGKTDYGTTMVKNVKYFVVDCDSPVPDDSTEESNTINWFYIACKLLENRPLVDKGPNIIVGVTQGDNIPECETALKIAKGILDYQLDNKELYAGYCVISVETKDIVAGLKIMPDTESELHIISSRPRTISLFNDKNCWWNKFITKTSTLRNR